METFRTSAPRRRAPLRAALLVALLAGSACASGQTLRDGGRVLLRLGHAPNLNHAVAMAGIETGIFDRALGDGVRLERKIFNAGPSAVEALFSGALDAAFLGPNPAMNAFLRSRGEAVRVVAGATSGGSFFVVRPGIRGPDDLPGARLATPQLGNTQDVALRDWLARHGLRTDLEGGGDVTILPQENAQILQTFRAGAIDGAWVPEPWATRLVLEGGARVLVDERDEWPDGRHATTVLVVRARFLRESPGIVRRLIEGEIQAIEWIRANPDQAPGLVNRALGEIIGAPLRDEVLAAAWSHLSFTPDPVARSMTTGVLRASGFGLLPGLTPTGLGRAFELSMVNEALRARRLPEVTRP